MWILMGGIFLPKTLHLFLLLVVQQFIYHQLKLGGAFGGPVIPSKDWVVLKPPNPQINPDGHMRELLGASYSIHIRNCLFAT